MINLHTPMHAYNASQVFVFLLGSMQIRFTLGRKCFTNFRSKNFTNDSDSTMKGMKMQLLLFLAISIASCRGHDVVPETVPGVAENGEPLPDMSEWLSHDHTKKIDWNAIAKERLDFMVKDSPYSPKKAQNIILFVGDGMGTSTVTSTRFYAMQKYQKALAFDYFPITGFSKTYNVNNQTPDSSGTATAFMCGEKTRMTVLGVNEDVELGKCVDVSDKRLNSVLRRSIEKGKWAGMATTTRITHATPAATYAFASHRNWESDSQRDAMLDNVVDKSKCPDIASQLIDDPINEKIRVILGGGRLQFHPINMTDAEHNDKVGLRSDNRTLPNVWRDKKIAEGTSGDKIKYVWKKDDFDAVDADNTDYLMGLFSPSHMNFESDRLDDTAGEPSLADMVEKAVRILRKSPEGFFLLVEGGRIDQAHHDNLAVKALEDTYIFSEAIQRTRALTDDKDTLIIATADHSHSFVINGYNFIDNDITGLGKLQNGSNINMQDDKPYTVLSYTNGPGFLDHRTNLESRNTKKIPRIQETIVHPRINLENTANIGDKNFYYDAAMYKDSETHGGEDVPVYASGPMSHLLSGTYEQNYIAHAMMYAACTTPYEDRPGCSDNESHKNDAKKSDDNNAATTNTFGSLMMVFTVFLVQTVKLNLLEF